MGKYKDYTNQICGCWKVIERDLYPNSKSHDTFWKCECLNCGNITSVRKTNLDKNPSSCNKCKGKIISQTMRSTDPSVWQIGDRYGILTIVGKGTRHNHHTYVQVQCDCGSDPFEVRLEHLKGNKNGRTISCGCLSESSGELKIRTILEQNNINFQKEYKVLTEDNKVMYFDFVIFNKENQIIKMIEYNGIQHFQPVDYWGGEKAFLNQKERDNRKIKYCNKNNILLQQIKYNEYDNINLELLLKGIENIVF